MERNVASQKWTVFAFNRTTNVPVTGDAANITAKIRVDNGTATASNDTNPTETEDGYYDFDLTQAESNGTKLQIFPESSTADVQVIGVPGVVYTKAANASLLGINSSGHVSRVTLVDTTTTNTDMRGTDSALTTLGSNAPAGWINEAAFENNAITDAKVASDVTIASVTGTVGGIAGTINTLDQLDTAQDAQHGTTRDLVTTGIEYVDTEVAAIKAKTDNLPASPAATGDIPSADITAIKAKTDQLAFTVANKVDATAEATVDAAQLAYELAQNGLIVDGFTSDALEEIQSAVSAVTATADSSVANGGPIEKIIGGDYLNSLGNAQPWSLVNAGDLASFAGASVKCYITVGTQTIESSGGLISTTTGATRAGYVEFDSDSWTDAAGTEIAAGVGEYQIVITESGGGVLKTIRGKATLFQNMGP